MRTHSFDKTNDPVRGSGIPPLGLVGTVLLFIVAAILLALATQVVIPALSARIDVEPVLLWFASAAVVVFAPLLLIAYFLLRREAAIVRPALWRDRLRFRPMTKTDWVWSIAGLALVVLLSGGTLAVLRLLWGDVDLHPAFMAMDPIDTGRYWILAAWLPFWVLNIIGEEFLWRGVVLPRQEVAFGRWAWLANGVGWLVFHVSFGATILLTLWPIVFILPYVVQRRQNSWVGVVIHAGLNGFGFLAIAFGLGLRA